MNTPHNSKYSDYIAFIDESGSPELSDRRMQLCTLTCVLFSKEDYLQFSKECMRLKFKHFGHHNIIIHNSTFAQEPANKDFLLDYSRLVFQTKFTIISIIYDKTYHPKYEFYSKLTKQEMRAYKRKNHIEISQRERDAYSQLLEAILTRLRHELVLNFRDKRITHVLIEQRSEKQNDICKTEALEIIGGKNNLDPRYDKKLPLMINFAKGDTNLHGLQLADMCTSEIAKWCRQDHPKINQQFLFSIIKKIRINNKNTYSSPGEAVLHYGIVIYFEESSKKYQHISSYVNKVYNNSKYVGVVETFTPKMEA